MTDEDFEFVVVSRRHGEFRVVAPCSVRELIEQTPVYMQARPRADGGFRYYAYVSLKSDERRRIGSHGVALHRHIWNLAGRHPAAVIDHIDRNTLNNSLSNLRATDLAGNARNASIRRDNTSGYIGVTKKRDKWMARAKLDGRDAYVGIFASPADAALARDRFVREHYGEFAVLNFPEAGQ